MGGLLVLSIMVAFVIGMHICNMDSLDRPRSQLGFGTAPDYIYYWTGRSFMRVSNEDWKEGQNK